MKVSTLLKVLPVVGVATAAICYFGNCCTESTYTSRAELASARSLSAYDYLHRIRMNTQTGTISDEEKEVMIKAAQKHNLLYGKSLSLAWENRGPNNVGGRTRGLLIDRNNPDILYTGGVAGGLFKSTNAGKTWERIETYTGNKVISAIVQTNDGTIVVGTGSVHENNPNGAIQGTPGFSGDGVYISTDGVNFSVAVDNNGTELSGSTWRTINELVAIPGSNSVWIAYGGGLAKYNLDDKTIVHKNPGSSSKCEDVATSADGQTMLISYGSSNRAYLSKDGGESWENLDAAGKIQGSNLRIEFAISQDDANYMYALAAKTGRVLKNLYGSEDGGATWEILVNGDNPWNPILGTQGEWNNTITVVPGKPRICMAAGLDVWRAGFDSQPEQLTVWNFPKANPQYVHADNHKMIWDSRGWLYIANDGGIFVSKDEGASFENRNRNYNVTQFYAIDTDHRGRLIGGTQDNGTQYVLNLSGSFANQAVEVLGGDGFDCALSELNPDILFASVYNGDIARSSDGGENFDRGASFVGNLGVTGGFNTTYELWETQDYTANRDSVQYTYFDHPDSTYDDTYNPTDKNTWRYQDDSLRSVPTLYAGTIIPGVKSKVTGVEFNYELTDSVKWGETIDIKDPLGSMYVFVGNGQVWMTRDALNFSKIPHWVHIYNVSGGFNEVKSIDFSADGNTMFLGDFSGRLVRLSGFNNAWTDEELTVGSPDYALTSTQIFSVGSSVISGISVDVSDNGGNSLVFCRGNLSTGNGRIFKVTDALGNFKVTDITGNFPKEIPCYDVVVNTSNPDQIIVGTDFGAYATEDGGENWALASSGMGDSPVVDLVQQTWWEQSGPGIENAGEIYAGTHGNGFFRAVSGYATGVADFKDIEAQPELTVFPNPLSTNGKVKMPVNINGKVQLTVTAITGKTALSQEVNVTGDEFSFSVAEIPTGTYVVSVIANGEQYATKIIVGADR